MRILLLQERALRFEEGKDNLLCEEDGRAHVYILSALGQGLQPVDLQLRQTGFQSPLVNR